jgi:hypothetical protein
MEQMNREKMLNWLNKEKKKDELEITQNKEKLIQEISKLDKTKMFTKPEEKNNIWKKIKKLIWGI